METLKRKWREAVKEKVEGGSEGEGVKRLRQ